MKTIAAYIFVIAVFAITGCYSTAPVAEREQYSYPDWVPAYEPGVRYYYIPDIETYYDLTSRSFVYLDRGRWVSSYDLPMMYRNYDLYNGYAIALDRRVHEPWRYHQNYVSSYPRYYYRSMYPDQNRGTIRGYNENARRPVYSDSPGTNTPRSSSPQVNQGIGSPGQPDQPAQPSSRSSVTNRRVGKPVKVTPEMRQPDKSEQAPAEQGSRRTTPPTETEQGSATQREGSSIPPPSHRNTEQKQTQESTGESKQDTRKESTPRRPDRRR